MPAQSFLIARLRFTSPLHLSRGRQTYDSAAEVLHADTLKSALFVCAMQLFGTEAITRASFLDGFTLSSAFPYFGDELFFPRPLLDRFPVTLGDPDDPGAKKQLKKISWLSQSCFEHALAGTMADPAHYQVTNSKFVSKKGGIRPRFWEKEVQQRVAIPSQADDNLPPPDNAEEPRPYYTERTYFTDHTGLFFLLKCSDEVLLTQLETALRLLGDHGIGTDKSTGNGQFAFNQFESLDLQVPENANGLLALSLYCPAAGEITPAVLDGSAYTLVKRGGYIASPENDVHITLRKRSVYMFAEGSAFHSTSLYGNCVDLQPDHTKLPADMAAITHPIWRDGRAIFLPIIL